MRYHHAIAGCVLVTMSVSVSATTAVAAAGSPAADSSRGRWPAEMVASRHQSLATVGTQRLQHAPSGQGADAARQVRSGSRLKVTDSSSPTRGAALAAGSDEGSVAASTATGTWIFGYGPGLWNPSFQAGQRNLAFGPAGDALAYTTGSGPTQTDVMTTPLGQTRSVAAPSQTYSALAWSSYGDTILRQVEAPSQGPFVLDSTTPGLTQQLTADPAAYGPPAVGPLGREVIARETIDSTTSDLVVRAASTPLRASGQPVTFPTRRLGLSVYRPGNPTLAQAPAAALGAMVPSDPAAPTYLAFLGVDPADPSKGHLYVDHQETFPTITPLPVSTFDAHPECNLPAPAVSIDRARIWYAVAVGDAASPGGVCGRSQLRSVTAGSTGRFDSADAVDRLQWWSDQGTPYLSLSTTAPTPEAYAYRIGGRDRYAVGVTASQFIFADKSADVAVVSGGSAYADALTGGPLAGEFGGPVLLTYPNALHSGVKSELARVLRPGATVYITGGPASVAPAVEQALAAPGRTVVRLGGSSRFEVAVNVAIEMDRRRGSGPKAAFVASGTAFADALVAGPAAVHETGSVLLSTGSTLPPATAAYLDSVGASLQHTYGVGGAGSAAVTGRPNVVPLTGASRFDVSLAVANRFFTGDGISGLADGRNWPDAVSGGAVMANLGLPIMLANGTNLPTQTRARFRLSRAAADAVVVFGGPASVPDDAMWQGVDQIGNQTPIWGPYTYEQ